MNPACVSGRVGDLKADLFVSNVSEGIITVKCRNNKHFFCTIDPEALTAGGRCCYTEKPYLCTFSVDRHGDFLRIDDFFHLPFWLSVDLLGLKNVDPSKARRR